MSMEEKDSNDNNADKEETLASHDRIKALKHQNVLNLEKLQEFLEREER